MQIADGRGTRKVKEDKSPSRLILSFSFSAFVFLRSRRDLPGRQRRRIYVPPKRIALCHTPAAAMRMRRTGTAPFICSVFSSTKAPWIWIADKSQREISERGNREITEKKITERMTMKSSA